ncbi:MAG: hypothetical protein K0R78_3509 [Pelosinus sp.]|jgi:hypothetical protein|nr:hypothetical protein [Pelosinus sp.]
MAIVGQQLTAPEIGWKRYDDTDSNISYSDTWSYSEDGLYYNGHRYTTTKKDDQVKFNFIGTKLRFIGAYNYHDSNNVEIVIDKETHNISVYGPTIICGALVFEIENLSLGEHSVAITNLEDGKYCTFIAIDIDENGELKPYSPQGTVTPPTPTTGNILLKITMNDSSEREYKVTQTEVDKFIQWINGTGRAGDNCYKFDDVIDASKEYLIFEKIISFKVFEL